jgi:hypothetical protein
MDTTKIKYLQTIGMHRMFSNVATFTVTNRSISSTKKKIFFQTFLPDILMTTTLFREFWCNFGVIETKLISKDFSI